MAKCRYCNKDLSIKVLKIHEKWCKDQDHEKENEESLESKKVPELKDMAKEKGIEGYSSMKKEELIEAIESL